MKKILILICLLILCSLTLLAQTVAGPRAAQTTENSASQAPPQEDTKVALKKIYSNLGKAGDLYYANAHSWLLSGPTAARGAAFIAMPFTPKSDSTVEQVQVAVLYSSGANNQVNLSIYGDTGGAPGTLLAGPVTVANLATAGTCCTLAVANFTPVTVTAGTQYWVVADTPLTGTGSDFSGVWNHVAKAMPFAVNRGTGIGWKPDNADNLPAGKVLGTIP